MKNFIVFFTIIFFTILNLEAQQTGTGTVAGVILEKNTGSPLEFATVIIKSNADSTLYQGTVTGKKGEFTFNKLAYGEYVIVYSFIGFDKIVTPVFSLTSKKSKLDLGKLFIYESTTTLGEISVTAQRSTFVNSIDRRTFNVGQDVMSKKIGRAHV
jgi:hypothetical protein